LLLLLRGLIMSSILSHFLYNEDTVYKISASAILSTVFGLFVCSFGGGSLCLLHQFSFLD